VEEEVVGKVVVVVPVGVLGREEVVPPRRRLLGMVHHLLRGVGLVVAVVVGKKELEVVLHRLPLQLMEEMLLVFSLGYHR